MPSRLTFFALYAFMRGHSRFVLPLQTAVQRLRVARSRGGKHTELAAEYAWGRGDVDAAMPLWRALEAAQPRRAKWPLAIARAASERGEFDLAERTLLDARARGIENDSLELSLLRYSRMIRRSNAAIADAEAIVADPKAPTPILFQAAFYLLAQNRLETARAGFERVLDDKEHGPLARGQLALVARLAERRAQGRPDLPGWLSPMESSILVREPASDTLVVGFGLPMGTISLSVNALHAMLSRSGVNALYLYDSRQILHLTGTDRFGPGYPAMLDGIRALAAELGTRRLITMGSSGTGFTALRTAIDLDADGALLFSPQTLMVAHGNPGNARSGHTFRRLRETVLPMMKNLRSELRARPSRPHVELYYSANNRRDRMHASNLAGLPNVRLHPLPGSTRHDCMPELASRGVSDLLDAFAAKP